MGPVLLDGDDFGGIRIGYQPDELGNMFFEYVRAHPEIHQELRNFQLTERHRFFNAEEQASLGEHKLEWSSCHQRFCCIIEKLMSNFHHESGLTADEFAATMLECRTEGSKWWTPFCQLVDTSDYRKFSQMLQDNICLCCGEPFLAYQSHSLLRMFIDFVKAHPHIHRKMRDFQLQERWRFITADEKVALGEHRLEWSDVHQRFVEMVEEVMQEFIQQSGCTEHEFTKAMSDCMKGCSSDWPPFAKLLDVSDYSNFSRMMQQNLCLCCGEKFSGYMPQEIAHKLAEYMKAHPAIHEELRGFQERERHAFFNVEECVQRGQHRLEWSDVHTRFLAMIDVHIQSFLEEIHCTDEEFMHAIDECRRQGTAGSKQLEILSMLLSAGDYISFALMFQSNICVCCGQNFSPDADVNQSVLPVPTEQNHYS